jgi:hypothetical protein
MGGTKADAVSATQCEYSLAFELDAAACIIMCTISGERPDQFK